MSEGNKATKASAASGPPDETDEPTKKEQRAALREANEATLQTRPTGKTEENEFGQAIPVFEAETEYERSVRINYGADHYPYEEPEALVRRALKARAAAEKGE